MNANSPNASVELDQTNNQVRLFEEGKFHLAISFLFKKKSLDYSSLLVIYHVPEMNPSNWQKMIKLMILNIQLRTNLMNEVTHLRAENLKLNSKL